MNVTVETKIEYSARILASDGDGNIYLPLGCVEIGAWAAEIRWVEDPRDQIWFNHQESVHSAIGTINLAYSKYEIRSGLIEYQTRTTTVEIISVPK